MKTIEGQEAKPQLKFSDDTRELFIEAAESARSLNHACIGTEHLLLASLKDPLISSFMKSRSPNSNPDGIRNSVLFIIGRGKKPFEGVCELTPRAKHVIELAAVEAKSQGKTQVEPSDVLLGMIREGEGVAAGTLDDIGLKLNSISDIRIKVKKFSNRFKKQVLQEEEILSLTTEVTIQRLQKIMRDPNIPLEKRLFLLETIQHLTIAAKFPQRKTQGNS